jgi:type III secretion protein O
MSFFKELLSIKRFREDKAELAVRKQKSILADALAQIGACEKDLADWRDYAVRTELALYDELCSRLVVLGDIEDVQQQVAFLREQERARVSKLDEARAEHAKQASHLDELRGLLVQATRAKEKFIELAQAYDDEILRESERKEEAEIEEATESRRDRRDEHEPVQEATE